jgi:hypothetical protein
VTCRHGTTRLTSLLARSRLSPKHKWDVRGYGDAGGLVSLTGEFLSLPYFITTPVHYMIDNCNTTNIVHASTIVSKYPCVIVFNFMVVSTLQTKHTWVDLHINQGVAEGRPA